VPEDLRDNRDPELLAVHASASRREGESLREAFDRMAMTDVPTWDSPEAHAARRRFNGHVGRANEALAGVRLAE
jgi:hypothetical protein